MFNTSHGLFDGPSWETLCQKVFKYKYGAEGYQSIPASPGDFGLEGFTIHTGLGFQCYCPEKNYSTADLLTKHRAKISTDIKKLQTYENELSIRLGSTKIREWHFVTPVISSHELLSYAKNKEKEARSWGLSILSNDFTIHLRDADFYTTEINQIKTSTGECLTFDTSSPELAAINGPMQEYEGNISRKSIARVGGNGEPKYQKHASKLAILTIEDFIHSTPYLKKIEADAPYVYIRIVRSVMQFELHIQEKCLTWNDTPEALTTCLKEEFLNLLKTDFQDVLDRTESMKIARAFISRWLAICQLDFID